MLANRPPASSLIAGALFGLAAALKFAPDTVLALLIASSCALVCLTNTSEKKIIIFLAAGSSAAIIDFILYCHQPIALTLAYIAATVTATLYLTEVLSK